MCHDGIKQIVTTISLFTGPGGVLGWYTCGLYDDGNGQDVTARYWGLYCVNSRGYVFYNILYICLHKVY